MTTTRFLSQLTDKTFRVAPVALNVKASRTPHLFERTGDAHFPSGAKRAANTSAEFSLMVSPG